MYLSYFGIRVRDIARSVKFYTEVFGLEQILPDPPVEWKTSEPNTALLRDPTSGQRVELNYYEKGNLYDAPYEAGEGLDHIAFRVDNLDEILRRLAARGFHPEAMKHYSGPIYTHPEYRVAYLRDPDDLQLELFESPGKEPVDFRPGKY